MKGRRREALEHLVRHEAAARSIDVCVTRLRLLRHVILERADEMQLIARARHRDVQQPDALERFALRRLRQRSPRAGSHETEQLVLGRAAPAPKVRRLHVRTAAVDAVELQQVDVLEVEAFRAMNREHLNRVVRERGRPALSMLARRFASVAVASVKSTAT